jgi:hypothetical protein
MEFVIFVRHIMEQTINKIEKTIASICINSHPREWDENFISFRLMQELRQIFNKKVMKIADFSKLVNWESYKNKGKQETHYGDIALLVTIQFSSGETLKGVACLEAKRNYNSGNFEAITIEQLERIANNMPYSHLLLYNFPDISLPLKFQVPNTWKSYMWVAPINTAKQLLKQTGSENWKVLRTSFPFTMFLTSRIFWGLDLDYREEVIKDIEEGLNNIINPSFLGVVNIYYPNQDIVQPPISNKWEKI